MKASAWAAGIMRARRGAATVPWSGRLGRGGFRGISGVGAILAYLGV
jgi:hypothetical protein